MMHHFTCVCPACGEARFRATSERITRAQLGDSLRAIYYTTPEKPMTTFFAARNVNYFDKASRKYPAWCAPSDTAQGAIAACTAEVANTNSPKEVWEMRLVGRVEPAPKPQPTFVPAATKLERRDIDVLNSLAQWVGRIRKSTPRQNMSFELDISPGDYGALCRYLGVPPSVGSATLFGVIFHPNSSVVDVEL
jgi:hypothetical protein